jgi:hypothetical protein
MFRLDLIALSLKGVLAWALLSALGWYFSKELGFLVLPLLEFVIRLATADFAPSLKLVAENHDWVIRLDAWTLRPLHLGGNKGIPAGRELTAYTRLLHALVPVIIELTILLAWPVRYWRDRCFLLAAGTMMAVLVVGATAPFVLLGILEISLQDLASEAQVLRPEPWTLSWMLFCEMGGNWVLPVIAALAVIILQRNLFVPPNMSG